MGRRTVGPKKPQQEIRIVVGNSGDRRTQESGTQEIGGLGSRELRRSEGSGVCDPGVRNSKDRRTRESETQEIGGLRSRELRRSEDSGVYGLGVRNKEVEEPTSRDAEVWGPKTVEEAPTQQLSHLVP